ncbi:MAG: hypothetical protein ABSG51_10615, partial [Terracidiphilus sp.]
LVESSSRMGWLVFWAGLWMVTWSGTPALSQQPAQPEVKPAPPTPLAQQKEELNKPSWDPAWDAMVEKALPVDLLSNKVARAVKPFCPRFKQMSDVDRRAYWAYFFQALAGAEAGLEPTADARHTQPEVTVKDTVTKRATRSEGLLQLAYMDTDRYKCDFDWDKDKLLPEKDRAKTILQPRNDLMCGIKILESQLIDKRKPLLSRSSYWSTLRPGTISYKVLAKQMTNVPAAFRVDSLNEAKSTKSGRMVGSASANTSAAGVN